MILNLSKKTVVSSNPIYIRSNLMGLTFLLKQCFYKNDSVVVQNCRIFCSLFLYDEVEALFINPDNSIFKINSLKKITSINLIRKRTLVLLPKGSAAIADTGVGDILDLNAELTTAQKKNFLKIPKLVVPVPTAIVQTHK